MAPIIRPRRWKTSLMSIATLLSLQIEYAAAVAETYCASINTGSSNGLHHNIYNSFDSCKTSCGGAYAFAIVQGSSCWCSNYAPGETTDTSDCDTQCVGYPFEFCGSTSSDLYGYFALGPEPQGTHGAGGGGGGVVSSSSPAPESTYVAPSSTPAYTPSQTPSQTPEQVSTQVLQTTINQVSTQSPVTVYRTEQKTKTTSLRPVTTVQRITISGAVETQVITSVATPVPQQSTSASVTSSKKSGLSNGAVAGITVGAILAAVIVGLLIFFACRRKRNQGDEQGTQSGVGTGSGGVKRNASVLSKVGLLRSFSNNEHPTSAGSAGGSAAMSERPLQITTFGLPEHGSGDLLPSAVTQDSNRNSKPMFVDHRLNPHALWMSHENASRNSVGTLHDDRDYSRPLEVRNPDLC